MLRKCYAHATQMQQKCKKRMKMKPLGWGVAKYWLKIMSPAGLAHAKYCMRDVSWGCGGRYLECPWCATIETWLKHNILSQYLFTYISALRPGISNPIAPPCCCKCLLSIHTIMISIINSMTSFVRPTSFACMTGMIWVTQISWLVLAFFTSSN